VICPSGRPEGVTRPEKTGLTLRGEAGVWDRESGDRIKGCDGTWIHAVGSLAGADGWNITNVAAFPISGAVTAPANLAHLLGARGHRRGFLQLAA
jgi:hypothetical protein